MGGGRGALIAAAILLLSCSVPVQCDAASALSQEQEIQRLRSKVAALEDEVSWSKDETSQLEDVVREKTAQIAALVGGLDALQVRNAADGEPVVKSSTSSALLEKQVENFRLQFSIERLGNDLEDQVRKGELLEARASEAERRLLELGHKLERVEKINIEQRKKIEELESDLEHSEAKISDVERKAKSTAEELAMVRGMWLPYWFASRSVHCQELASAKWHLHGKPVLHALTHKVAETLAHVQRFVEPHLKATQNKLVPIAKVHFNSLNNKAKPYVMPVATRCSTAYRASRDAMEPCIVKTQELAGHYWQASKKLSRPYIARMAAASEPHLSRVHAALGPYMRPAMSSWRRLVMATSMYHHQASKKFSEPYIARITAASEPNFSRVGVVLEPYMRPVMSAWRRLVIAISMYHHQVQKGVGRFLEENELMNPPSAYRLAWWMGSALLALPMLAINKIFSVIVRKKIQARPDRGEGRPSRRKHTRRVDT